MKRVIALVSLSAVISGQAFAIGSVTGKVIQIRIDQEGRGMVTFDQPIGNQPASCRHSAYTNALAFDTNTPGGNGIMAMAIAAKATGDTISAYGTGNCNVYLGSWVEDWAYGVVK